MVLWQANAKTRLEHLFVTASSRARNESEPPKVYFMFLSKDADNAFTQILRSFLPLNDGNAPANLERAKRD